MLKLTQNFLLHSHRHIPPLTSSGSTLSLSALPPCFLNTVRCFALRNGSEHLGLLFSTNYLQYHSLPSPFPHICFSIGERQIHRTMGKMNVGWKGPLETSWSNLLLKNRALCWVTQGPVKQSISLLLWGTQSSIYCSHGEDLFYRDRIPPEALPFALFLCMLMKTTMYILSAATFQGSCDYIPLLRTFPSSGSTNPAPVSISR